MESEKRELTPEEIKERKDNLKKYYLEQIEFLKIQKEYEELLRDIETAKADVVQIRIALSQFYANSQKAEEEFNMAKENASESMEEDLPPVKRSLKREM